MKAKALNECTIPESARQSWHGDRGLMAFLRALGRAARPAPIDEAARD